MPLYEKKCLICLFHFEVLIRSSEEREKMEQGMVHCPRCQSRKLEEVICAPAFQFRPSFYGSYRGDCSKPFENFTLQNVHDENGKKVKVNSLAELRAAEHKYQFSLDIASMDKPHREADEAPQNDPHAGDITADYEWRWARTKEDRARSMASSIVTVDCGIAANESETLAGKVKQGKVA